MNRTVSRTGHHRSSEDGEGNQSHLFEFVNGRSEMQWVAGNQSSEMDEHRYHDRLSGSTSGTTKNH